MSDKEITNQARIQEIENWDKLSFIFDGRDNENPDDYDGRLYDVLDRILTRLEKLESKSHMHKMQLPGYKPPSQQK